MLDCREQKTIEKLSEELEKAGYTHISFQVVHTKSRTTSVRGHKSVKKQDSEDAVYVIEAAHDGKKGKSYWTALPGAEDLITMLRENLEALGEKMKKMWIILRIQKKHVERTKKCSSCGRTMRL